MTVDETSGHLRAAADSLSDVRTDLLRAKNKAPSDEVEEIIDEADDVITNMRDLLREVAVSAELEERIEAEADDE